jgi:hypothetical protein
MMPELQYHNKTDLSRFAGQWIAILHGDVVAHGTELKDVYEAAEKIARRERPLYTWVPVKDASLIL